LLGLDSWEPNLTVTVIALRQSAGLHGAGNALDYPKS
jgi:hypothetical protein